MASLPLFVIRPAYCPACQHKGYTRYPDPKLYRASDRESDMHVTEYTWTFEAGEGILPHFYDVWQCPECLYSDLSSNVERPERTVKDHHSRIAWEQVEDEKREAITELRTLVPEVDMTQDGALALHASALLIATLPKAEFADYDRIARLALRLGWLFRERRGSIAPSKSSSHTTDNLLECVELLESQLNATATAIDATKIAIHTHVADHVVEESSVLDGEETENENSGINPLMALTSSLDDKLREMRTLLTMLHTTVGHAAQHDTDTTQISDSSRLGQLGDVLLSAKRAWPNMPVTEAQCLRMTISYLKRSHRDQGQGRSIEDTLTDHGLILELLIRLGDHEAALDAVTKIYNTGMDHKRELNRRVSEGRRKKRLSSHDEKMLARKIGIVHMAIQRAGERRHAILDLMHQDHNEQITSILSDTSSLPSDAKVEALVAAGIPESLVTFLKVKKMLG